MQSQTSTVRALIRTLRALPLLCVAHVATTRLYTLSLHDALPISHLDASHAVFHQRDQHRSRSRQAADLQRLARGERKSTRLNSSHSNTSYPVVCLKKQRIPPLDLHKGITEAEGVKAQRPYQSLAL